MIKHDEYKGFKFEVEPDQQGYTLFVCIAADEWVETLSKFKSPDDAIAYGKEQIDILLSKSLNL